MKRKLKRPPYIHFVCACLVWSQEKKMNGKFKHGEIATKLRSQQRIWWSMQFTLTEMKEQLLRKEFVTLLIRGIWSTAKLKLLVCVTIKWYKHTINSIENRMVDIYADIRWMENRAKISIRRRIIIELRSFTLKVMSAAWIIEIITQMNGYLIVLLSTCSF